MISERPDGVLRLTGHCGIDDSESLLSYLQQGGTVVDVDGCQHLHAALLQLLMAARPRMEGAPAPFIQQWLLPLLKHSEE